MQGILELLAQKTDATTIVLVVVLLHVRTALRSMFTLLVRIAKHLGVPTDDVPPPASGIPEFIDELEHARTQPTTVPPATPAPATTEAAKAVGFKP